MNAENGPSWLRSMMCSPNLFSSSELTLTILFQQASFGNAEEYSIRKFFLSSNVSFFSSKCFLNFKSKSIFSLNGPGFGNLVRLFCSIFSEHCSYYTFKSANSSIARFSLLEFTFEVAR